MLQSSDEPRQCPMCYDGGETQMGVTKDGKSVLEVCGRYAYGIEADSQVQDSGKGVCVCVYIYVCVRVRRKLEVRRTRGANKIQ